MIIEAKPLHKKKKRLKKLSGKMVSNYGGFDCCNNQLYVVERYTLNCIKHWRLRNIYNEWWDSLALWVHIYMITAARTWWMMEVIHTFLEKKDYHNKAISWIVRKMNHRISIYMNIFQKTFGFHHSWIMLLGVKVCVSECISVELHAINTKS